MRKKSIGMKVAVLEDRFQKMKGEYTNDLVQKLRGILVWVLQIAKDLVAGDAKWPDDERIPVTGKSTQRRCKRPIALRDRSNTSTTQTKNFHPLRSASSGGKVNKASPKVHSQVFYCSLMVWYVMHNAETICDSEEVKEEIWKRLGDLAGINNTENGYNSVPTENGLGCVLRWFHSHSIVKISEKLYQEDQDRFEGLHINVADHLDNSEKWRAKAGKAVRLYGQGRFARQIIGHEIANIVSLCEEIDAKDESTIVSGLSCLEYVRELVKTRPETDKIESGAPHVERWDASHDMTSAMPRPAPWELSCLGHHLPGM